MSFDPIPKNVVYLEDRRGPFIETWEWLTTIQAFIERLSQGDVENISLDYDMDCTDPGRTGLEAVTWMEETGNWPSKNIQLHTGDHINREKMAAVIVKSGLFTGPEDHPLGDVYTHVF
jgi:hypothetical protein